MSAIINVGSGFVVHELELLTVAFSQTRYPAWVIAE